VGDALDGAGLFPAAGGMERGARGGAVHAGLAFALGVGEGAICHVISFDAAALDQYVRTRHTD
jgi:hypothetical protein